MWEAALSLGNTIRIDYDSDNDGSDDNDNDYNDDNDNDCNDDNDNDCNDDNDNDYNDEALCHLGIPLE